MMNDNGKNVDAASEQQTAADAAAEQTDELKALMKLRRREVRSLLIGDIAYTDDGRLAAGERLLFTPYGIGDRAGSTAIFGVKRKQFYYESGLNERQAVFQVNKAMKNIGRELVLQTAPGAACCFVKGILLRPTVLTFEKAPEGNFVLTVFCGRSPLAFLAVKRVLKRFDAELDDKIKRKGRKKK